jgi:hypothetical protein
MKDIAQDSIESVERRMAIMRSLRRKKDAVRLGEVIKEMVDSQISPRQENFTAVDKLWKELLPQGILEHCRIASLASGKMTVNVDSSAYMYELQLAGSELLKQLQQHCPRAGVAKIRFVLA